MIQDGTFHKAPRTGQPSNNGHVLGQAIKILQNALLRGRYVLHKAHHKLV